MTAECMACSTGKSVQEFCAIYPQTIGCQCKGIPNTDWSCCTASRPCNVGGGDCDQDSDCAGNLKCGSDNCQTDFPLQGSNWATTADCCIG